MGLSRQTCAYIDVIDTFLGYMFLKSSRHGEIVYKDPKI